MLLFFFSSRRRHTRYWRDWSSDVCSSDLRVDPALPVLVLSGRGEELDRVRGFDRGADDYVVKPFSYPELRRRIEALLRRARSEERRVGKECRSRWSPYH